MEYLVLDKYLSEFAAPDAAAADKVQTVTLNETQDAAKKALEASGMLVFASLSGGRESKETAHEAYTAAMTSNGYILRKEAEAQAAADSFDPDATADGLKPDNGNNGQNDA